MTDAVVAAAAALAPATTLAATAVDVDIEEVGLSRSEADTSDEELAGVGNTFEDVSYSNTGSLRSTIALIMASSLRAFQLKPAVDMSRFGL